MHFRTTTSFLLLTAAAAAATTADSSSSSGSTSSSSCQAQNILDACLSTTQPQLQACTPNDWSCLCTQSNNVLTCYNNCPNDPKQFGAQQTSESYCNAAKAYSSPSATPSSNPSATAGSAGSAGTATKGVLTKTKSAAETTSTAGSDDAASASQTPLSGVKAAASQGNSASSGGVAGVMTMMMGAVLVGLAVGMGVVM